MGILYIVGTPIGNLQDITLRGLTTLFHVDTIACEDTRRTGILLSELEKIYHQFVYKEDRALKKPKLLSYFEQNELRRIPEILSLLINGQTIALVSDAGMPTISDPGFKLVREAIRQGIKVEVIPGPTSIITALVGSGLPTDKFMFLGYPPAKSGHRKKLFEQIKVTREHLGSTVIFFEAPHKVIKTITEMQDVFGDIEVVFARELTKLHEEVVKKHISQALLSFEKVPPRGEFVLLFHLDK
jgi:16S rRNA (cytidine1402-2'-O)-methyltransferase